MYVSNDVQTQEEAPDGYLSGWMDEMSEVQLYMAGAAQGGHSRCQHLLADAAEREAPRLQCLKWDPDTKDCFCCCLFVCSDVFL